MTFLFTGHLDVYIMKSGIALVTKNDSGFYQFADHKFRDIGLCCQLHFHVYLILQASLVRGLA